MDLFGTNKMNKLKLLAGVALLGLGSAANAELCERAGGDAYYDTVLDITWMTDANILETAGLHPSGQMPIGVALSYWLPLINQQSYMGISNWRLPKWFDQGAQYCNYEWDGGADCGWNMDSMSSENWYNYSVNMGLTSKWASKDDFYAVIEQEPWGTHRNSTYPFTNIEVARRYHNDGWCEDRIDETTGEPDHYIGFHYEYGGQHCDGIGSTGFIWAVVDGDVAPGAGDMTTCLNNQVELDIVPGDATNTVDPDALGTMEVAVLYTAVADGDPRDFDPATIDPATIQFGPLGAAVTSPIPDSEDVDGDTDFDLVYTFNIQDTGIACEDASAELSAETYGAEPLNGTDSITTPECDDGGCHP